MTPLATSWTCWRRMPSPSNAGLPGAVGGVVPDVDVLAEELGARAVAEERALVEEREATEIPEHEADNVENRGGLEDDGVFAGC